MRGGHNSLRDPSEELPAEKRISVERRDANLAQTSQRPVIVLLRGAEITLSWVFFILLSFGVAIGGAALLANHWFYTSRPWPLNVRVGATVAYAVFILGQLLMLRTMPGILMHHPNFSSAPSEAPALPRPRVWRIIIGLW